MAIGSSHIAPGWLVRLQCLATWQQGGCDGNRAWPHGTREAGMATVPGHMAQGWLLWQQGMAKSTRESWMASGSCHMPPGG